ncbi:Uncharacterized protein Fot_14968 [Forsythia ovata]|uniref:Uncharacterized protein n=1 Tax=Forsythia ovata TaxID=205694 RepID=A0ABD1WBG5_9LAMI
MEMHEYKSICFACNTSPTRGRYTFGRASQRRSTQGRGTRSIRENNGYQELNTLNDELGYENIDDLTRGSNKTRGPNRGTPMPADRSQRIQISIEGDTFFETFVPRDITATMKAYFDGTYPTFCSMPLPIRDDSTKIAEKEPIQLENHKAVSKPKTHEKKPTEIMAIKQQSSLVPTK